MGYVFGKELLLYKNKFFDLLKKNILLYLNLALSN